LDAKTTPQGVIIGCDFTCMALAAGRLEAIAMTEARPLHC